MESTGRWSSGLGSLNPKCHYAYQAMRGGGGVASHPHPPDPPLIYIYQNYATYCANGKKLKIGKTIKGAIPDLNNNMHNNKLLKIIFIDFFSSVIFFLFLAFIFSSSSSSIYIYIYIYFRCQYNH